MSENLPLALCHRVVRDVARLAREKYVYPAVGEELAASLEARLEEGGYDDACEPGELALRLTEDLRALSNDGHWAILYDPHNIAANHALAHLIEVCPDDQCQRDLAWEADIAASLYAPVQIGEETLARYAGDYGRRCFAVEDGALTYASQLQGVAWKLVPLTATRFRLDKDVKFEFVVDEGGIATAVHVSYRDGRPDTIDSRTRHETVR